MTSELRLWCCPHFQREVEAAVAGSPQLAGLKVEPYAFPCLQGVSANPETMTGFLAEREIGEAEAVIGGGCLRGWYSLAGCPPEVAVLAPDQCFHLVAPPALVDSLLAEGAYLLTPGWLADWRKNIDAWGFDRPTARQFFHETTRKLVLLDTEVENNTKSEMAAMGDYLDLPWQTVPVGLDMFKLSLERLVLDLRREARHLPPPDQYFADQLMVIEIVNDLLTSRDENEVLARMEELVGLLFAPGRLNYYPTGTEPEELTVPDNEEFVWSRSGQGFVISMRHGEEKLGTLELDELAFAEYKERYLGLALPLVKVCGMAIADARVLEARQKADQAIRAMAGIVESSGDAIIGMTLEGILVSWNKGARHMFAYSRDEVLGRHVSFLTPQEEPDLMPRELNRIRIGRSTGQIETIWLNKDSRRLNVSLQVSPIRDADGQAVGASGIARDITEEKQRIERERRALEDQLHQAQKLESIGRLAAGVAHDFNNMLSIILGYSELLQTETELEQSVGQGLEAIHQAAIRAKGITRQLLAFARKQVLEMTNLSLNEVVADFSKMIKRLIGEDIQVIMALQDDLPLIQADLTMMEQILLNLVVNARDAMPNGGTLTLETRAVYLDQNYSASKIEVPAGDYVMLAMTDTGKGMDEATQRKIFEPFFTTKGPSRGTGLGLSTVYGIVKQHGGSIWVYSEVEQGTSFKVYLPIVQKVEISDRKVEGEALPPVSGETILVVEDETGLRQFIVKALTESGYVVLNAETPSEAQLLAKRHQGIIHLMLTDVIMPEMNGKALYENLIPQRPEMKVVYMSGYTENVIAYRGVLEEGVNFIQKPFSIKQLVEKIGTALVERR